MDFLAPAPEGIGGLFSFVGEFFSEVMRGSWFLRGAMMVAFD